METNLKEVLGAIHDMEEKIKTRKEIAIACVNDAERWNGAETASTFATRLHGEIQYLNGMYAVLNMLDYYIEYDKKTHHVTGIRPRTDED